MNNRPHFFNSPLTLVALLACLFIGYQAIGSRHESAAPASVATLDLEEVFNKLTEYNAEKARIKTMADLLDEQNKSKQEELKALQDELENVYTPDTPNYKQAEENLIYKTIEYQAWREFELRRIDREQALVLQMLYNKIKRGLEDSADREGYDVVILNDSLKELAAGTEAAVNQQISARRVLFARGALDITDNLITRMNNAYNTGR